MSWWLLSFAVFNHKVHKEGTKCTKESSSGSWERLLRSTWWNFVPWCLGGRFRLRFADLTPGPSPKERGDYTLTVLVGFGVFVLWWLFRS